MPYRRLIAAMLAGGLLTAACGTADSSGDDDGAGSGDGAAAAASMELVADLAPGDAAAVGSSVNQFGFDLLGQLTDGTENTVTSPVSAAALLAMVLAGAGGQTADEMAGVLHLDDARDVRVGALLRELADTDDVTLSVANALWAREGYPFEDDYLAFTRDSYGATVDDADLGSQQTADEIDAWVRDQTEDRIDGIAEDLGLPNADAVLVLLNAVYFLGTWTTQFDPGDTREERFTLADGESAMVPLMHLTDVDVPVAVRDGYQMLRLPYGEDERYAMEILLPDHGVELPQLLASLDAAEWTAATGALTEQTISDVALPRFELEWDADLNDALVALGMGSAFGGGDFTPMSPENPFLDVVVQKTYIRVDEAGTEAAAVTGGVMTESAGQTFRVDRPFAFTISDGETGTILFLGAVTDPRG
ncbi:serpin family protein [Jiangella ureilytica]|uniref:Serpin family protein n=1 Tax=Jiangella ureilytica TaxID=2530374 RepID=A0A4R4RR99_9ACTN|nr:serpin family protein [Jiangella ureilytica]TDC51262.1 serpin family protein [Jiangella ureilytica]